VHKTANVLDKSPKSVQLEAKRQSHQMYLSPGRALGLEGYERLHKLYGAKYPTIESDRRHQIPLEPTPTVTV